MSVRARAHMSSFFPTGFRRGGRGGCSDEEDDDDGYEVNGDVLQWRVATQNSAVLTLEGYNWELGRGAMPWWWAGLVVERAGGAVTFPSLCCHACQKWQFG